MPKNKPGFNLGSTCFIGNLGELNPRHSPTVGYRENSSFSPLTFPLFTEFFLLPFPPSLFSHFTGISPQGKKIPFQAQHEYSFNGNNLGLSGTLAAGENKWGYFELSTRLISFYNKAKFLSYSEKYLDDFPNFFF